MKQLAEKLTEFDNRLVESERHRAEFNKHRLEFDRHRAEFDKHRKDANARLAELDKHRAVKAASRAESAIHRKEAEEHRKKAAEYRKEAAEHRAEFDKYCAKREKFLYKLDRRLDKIAKMVGAMGNTDGRIAEEFFYLALRRAPHIGSLEFDDIRANVTAGRRGKSAEYDILMANGEFVAIVEVKRNLRESGVEKMREVLVPNFRFLFRELSDKILVPTVSGITANSNAVTLAHECGYALLLPDG